MLESPHVRLLGNLPSPLAGEGVTVVEQVQLGEGSFAISILAKRPPHPFIVVEYL
jgi:hypothetical protein